MSQQPGFAWMCAACGKPASAVMLVAPGEADPRMRWADAPPGTETTLHDHHRVSIQGGPVSVTISIDPATAPAVWRAVEAADAPALFAIDRELAPFWCPECAEPYCGDHYQSWDVYDGAFFDCVRGRCPRGHERMLMD